MMVDNEKQIQEHDKEIALINQRADYTNKLLTELKNIIEENHSDINKNIQKLRDTVATLSLVKSLMQDVKNNKITLTEHSHSIMNLEKNKSFIKENWYKVIALVFMISGVFIASITWKNTQDIELKNNKMTNDMQSKTLKELSIKMDEIMRSASSKQA